MPDFKAESDAILAEVLELRHALHERPELGLELPYTQRAVLDALADLPLEVTTGTRSTSVTAVLRGGAADPDLAKRPIVLLRGDMDGLPVAEETGMPFASKVEGRMHACGHDVHTSALVGAARLLCAHQAELPGDVVFMFQTGEEILQGALRQIDDGVLEAAGRKADRAFGMHVMSAVVPPRQFSTRAGAVMAGSDLLKVDIIGRGGHGSAPHLALDPVPVMGDILTALQTLVTRRFSVFDPVVITAGVANAGGAANVIPERCHVEASIRTFSPANRDLVEQLAPQVVRGIAAAWGMTAEIEYVKGVPPTYCDAEAAAFAAEQVKAVLGDDRFEELPVPFAGSEDFSFVLEQIPGAFVFYSGLPAGTDVSKATFNHSATAWFDDVAVGDAVAVYAQLAWGTLHRV